MNYIVTIGDRNYIVDATPVECDINVIKQFITQERLKKRVPNNYFFLKNLKIKVLLF